jgi:PPP family 3-phenylpropionic acid transporter
MTQGEKMAPEIGRINMAIRLATFYGMMSLFNGVGVPYWPVFLRDRGLGATEIAIVFMATYMTRMCVNPVIGALADRHGNLRRAILTLIVAATFGVLVFYLCFDFWSILIATILLACVFPSIFPIMEAITLRGSAARNLDYARVRVSGSISFILGSLVMGALVERFGATPVLPGCIAALVIAFLAGLFLPDLDRNYIAGNDGAGTAVPRRSAFGAMGALLKQPAFLLMAISGNLIQASHGPYYAFATLNWRAQGYDAGAIGMLWAIGVIAEVTLFIFSKPVVTRLGPGPLLVLGGAAGFLRWSILAFSPSTPITAAAQVLHAFSYGATHLAAMGFLVHAVPREAAASAQTLYGSLFSGFLFGVVTLAAGPLFDHFGAGLYGLSAGCAGLGLIVGLGFMRVFDGRPLSLGASTDQTH